MELLNALKSLFTKNSTAASTSGARIPILNSSSEVIGSDGMANLASFLGVPGKYDGKLIHLSDNIGYYRFPKPNSEVAVLFCAVNGDYLPSIFALNRDSTVVAIYEGGIKASSVSMSDGYVKVVINLGHFYYRLFAMEHGDYASNVR